jgi:alpha/beta superfamily hydrolase
VSVDVPTTGDTSIRADLAPAAEARAAALICHPHPQYGGDRHDHVVAALFVAFPAIGITALRFDFRRAVDDRVAGFDDAVDDAVAALAELRRAVPDMPVVAAGYSFGAMVVLALDAATVAGKILVAPPLTAMPIPAAPSVPTLVLAPEHDQFTPAAAAAPIVETWAQAQLVPVPTADHFLHGRTPAVVAAVEGWIDTLLA